MPVARAAFSCGITSRATPLLDDGVYRDPLGVAQLRNGRRIERGQHGEHSVEIALVDVQHESHLRLRINGAAQHECDLVDLLALPGIGQCRLAGDKMRLAFHHGVDDFQVIGLERAARLGDFDDGVGEHGRLHFRRAPTEFNFYVHALCQRSSAC